MTDSQNEKLMSIYATCCEGEHLDDKLVNPADEDDWTVFRRLYVLSSVYLATVRTLLALDIKKIID